MHVVEANESNPCIHIYLYMQVANIANGPRSLELSTRVLTYSGTWELGTHKGL